MVNEINSSTSGIVHSTDTRNTQIDKKKVDTANPATSTNPASSNVNLTQTATSLQALEKAIAAAPEVDQQKVDSVRKAINEGTYQIDAERTATRLIDFDTALPKSSK